MKKTITFLIKTKDEIPTLGKNESLKSCNCSDFFFAKVKTISGEESNSIVCYDFQWSKWRSLKSGFQEVIEYYMFDEQFNNWMHSESPDLDIFNAIDVCDR